MDYYPLLRSAFLRYLQTENACERTGEPCNRDYTKCGCDAELREYVLAEHRDNQQFNKTEG